MKKLTILTSVLLSFLIFTACDNEPIDSAIDITTINQGPVPIVLDCTETTQALALASLNFSNADSSNYSLFCNTYKTALQNQITACGDTEGDLQELINELGDCSFEDTDCFLKTSAAQTVLNALNLATEDNYSTVCNTYKGALQNQIEACGDPDGSIQVAINDLGDCSW